MFSISLIDVWWLLMSGIVQITEAVATTAHIQCFFFIIIIALLKKKSNHVVSICRWKLRAEKIDWMCVCWSVVRLVNIVTLCVFFFLICIHFFWSLCCFSVGLANQLDELFNWILLCVRPSDWTLWNETLSIVANCSRTIRFDERFFFLSVLSQYIYLLAMKNWWMQRGHFFGRHVKRHRRGLQLSQIN